MQLVKHTLLGTFIAAFALTCQSAEPILIGVAPHSSARVIIESHATLRDYLENQFHQPVQIVTAPTFSEFTRRSLKSSYDLLITSPHLAVIAKEHAGYEPLMTYTQGLETVLVGLSDKLPEQKPLRVVGLDPVSFVTLTGLHYLKEIGLSSEADIKVSYASASDSASLMVTQGKADIAIMSWPNYTKLNDELRNKVAVVWKSEPKPSRVYLIKEGKGLTKVDWQTALKGFTESAEGEKHLTENKLKGFKSLTYNDLIPVKPLADAALKLLESTE
jgi:phosphonate transport system substrate-binding protein